MKDCIDEKLAECKEMFDLFDKDGDGSITTKELGQVFKSLGANLSQAELQSKLMEIDQDGSGKIEFKEFYDLYCSIVDEPETEEDYLNYFKMFDKNNDGYISLEEFKEVLLSMGEKLSNEEVARIMKRADKNSDMKLDFEEFKAYMKDN